MLSFFLHDACINILQSPKGRDAWAPDKIKTNTVTGIIKQIKKKLIKKLSRAISKTVPQLEELHLH